MKRLTYSLFLTILLGLPGLRVLAQDLTTTEIDGTTYYEIGTAEDLVAFATMVNSESPAVNAILTADIDLEGTAWEAPIGTDGANFQGIFDGRGHAIVGFEYVAVGDYNGLFGCVSNSTVKDFSISGNLTSDGFNYNGTIGCAKGTSVISGIRSALNVNVSNAKAHSAGILGSTYTSGHPVLVENCEYSGTFTHSGTGDCQAGILGYTYDGGVRNCLFSGTIIGEADTKYGGILGYCKVPGFLGVQNCLSTGKIVVPDGIAAAAAIIANWNGGATTNVKNNYFCLQEGSTVSIGIGNKAESCEAPLEVTAEQLAGGEVCFKLNGDQSSIAWYQTLGTDDVPVPDATHGTVYMNGHKHCDGTPYDDVIYANTDEGIIQDAHNFVDGFCTECDAPDEEYATVNAEGFYEIGTPTQLIWFAAKVNAGEYDAKAVLTADIDMDGADISRFPIGAPEAEKRFVGTFDGQGHHISNFLLINPSAPTNFGMFNTNTGVVLRNFWLDSTCKIEGTQIVSLVGRHDGGGTFEGVGNCADVTGTNNNIGGLFGAVMGNSSDRKEVIIRNCWSAGKVVSTDTSAKNYQDCGALTGWFNNALITIEGFWTIAEVEHPKEDKMYVYRNGGGATFNSISRCYSMHGAQSKFPSFTDEQLKGGWLCWMLNDQSFIDVTWRQKLGQDAFPTPYGTGDIVYQKGSESFGSFNPEDPSAVAAFIGDIAIFEKAYTEEVVAYQPLIDDYSASVEAWADIETYEDFCTAYTEAMTKKEALTTSANLYAAYVEACLYASNYMTENTLEGDMADFLRKYLEEEVEPGTDYPNGSMSYILSTLGLDDEEIVQETAFVNQMLENAIAGGITAGTEITRLLANANFTEGFEGWQTEYDGGSIATGGVTSLMPIARGLNNKTFNFSQTLTELPNGVYMMAASGLFRAGADVASQFYAGQLYLNGTANYFMSPGEDALPESEAEDKVNCDIASDAKLVIDDEEGYVPNAIGGCSYAFSAGRYLNFTATTVTDGSLTVGVRNLGTGLASDWLPFGGLHVFYLGTEDEANEQLTDVLQGFTDRAQIIVDFAASEDPEYYTQYPNISAQLAKELYDAIAEAEEAETGAQKMELIQKFSDLFAQVHACRKAYIAMLKAAENLFGYLDAMLSVVAITDAEYDEWAEKVYDAQGHFIMGDVTTEEALAIAAELNSPGIGLPIVNGYFQVASAPDLQLFSLIVNSANSEAKAVLCEDIDMLGIEDFQPIGNAETPFEGEFNGQGYTISNFGLYQYLGENDEIVTEPLPMSGDRQGLFGNAKGATIQNFSIDGTIEYQEGTGIGVVGWAEGCTIRGIHSTLDINVPAVSHHIGGIVGSMRSGTWVEGCSFSGSITETAGSHDCIGGIAGYGNENCRISNCAFYGSVSFTASNAYAAGILGYVNNTAFGGVQNCLSVGNVSIAGGTAQYAGSIGGRIRNNTAETFQNNYWLEGSAPRVSGENEIQGEAVGETPLASGEVCYRLNGDQTVISWYQTINEDAFPVLLPTHEQVFFNADEGLYYNLVDGVPVGVGEIEAQEPAVSEGIYNLAGQRLSRMQRGINIVGGKKILVK